jgi:hypothetical protein
MFICTNLLFRGPVAVGDSALYVLCDESCLTADKPARDGQAREIIVPLLIKEAKKRFGPSGGAIFLECM